MSRSFVVWTFVALTIIFSAVRLNAQVRNGVVPSSQKAGVLRA